MPETPTDATEPGMPEPVQWPLELLMKVANLRKSLQMIARTGCEELTACRGGRSPGSWCNACIARDALEELGTVPPGATQPRGCDIEIVELTHHIDGNPGIVVPNEIRINGRPVLAPAHQAVIVHGIEVNAEQRVQVTLTLFARIVSMRQEAKTDA